VEHANSLQQAKTCASASIARLKNPNMRIVDALPCRLYSYFSYVHELTNTLAEIRG
jgi:26S proteasome regulatory subunit N3